MEFLQNISINQFADIGFGLLVAGICIKTLFTDKNALKKQRELWREELQELEKSLKTLITEASDASEVFDKNIRHRQRELTSLLERAEKTISETKSLSDSAPSEFDDLSLKKTSSSNDQENIVIDPPWAQNSSEEITAAKGASLRYKTLTSLGKISNEAKATTLKSQIEIEKDEEEKHDNEIFQQTSIVDPVAFKIAKRLLLAGRELHIVARKLELPVSEIRHLDSLLRERAQKENLPLPKALEEKEIRRVRGIVRDPVAKPVAKSVGKLNIHSSTNESELF